MIPLQLNVSGFLSYRDLIEVDFTTFDLACISGLNGAGKSSLLDAITWSLFGQARRRDESLINLQSKSAEVIFTFQYEANIYRVQRSLPRGKGTTLEFQLQDGSTWRPLTERTLRETQARIEQILRLNYDTFVNAAFFLQGKADQFTQQTASKRKEVLGSILGLETWDDYRTRTAERRRRLEDDIRNIDGRIIEIDNELDQEDQRKTRLTELKQELQRMTTARKTQGAALESMKVAEASLENQRKLVKTLVDALERSQTRLSTFKARLAGREKERAEYTELLDRASEIESDFHKWKQAQAQTEQMDSIAVKFREHEKLRIPLLEEITIEKAKLEQEQKALQIQQSTISAQESSIIDLKQQIEASTKTLEEVQAKRNERDELENRIATMKENAAALKAENLTMKAQMSELKARIDQLSMAEGVTCPLCGQDLSDEHRKSTLENLQKDGNIKGDRYRANNTEMKSLLEQVSSSETEIAEYASIEKEYQSTSTTITKLNERLENAQKQAEEWKSLGAKRLGEIEKSLGEDSYASTARKRLKKIDKDLEKLGYDSVAHDAIRQAESEQRKIETEYNKLENARAALKPIVDEINNLTSDIEKLDTEFSQQRIEHDAATTSLVAAESQAPDLDKAYSEFLHSQEQENQLTQEVGAARQKVDVLKDLRKRKKDYVTQREDINNNIARHKTLERAFGRDGVPALLIEQALPQIEARANELLDRLSDGQMSIRFVTQAAYKDTKRADLKETLDIQVSDSVGIRDYEMYSGGEAFRVNFAIRLALSEVLASRKGARLQTMVIDEGFGSQDGQGRQRLIEAINTVKADFAKIIVITHLEELKDAFPTRIEVEKTARGSVVNVI